VGPGSSGTATPERLNKQKGVHAHFPAGERETPVCGGLGLEFAKLVRGRAQAESGGLGWTPPFCLESRGSEGWSKPGYKTCAARRLDPLPCASPSPWRTAGGDGACSGHQCPRALLLEGERSVGVTVEQRGVQPLAARARLWWPADGAPTCQPRRGSPACPRCPFAPEPLQCTWPTTRGSSSPSAKPAWFWFSADPGRRLLPPFSDDVRGPNAGQPFAPRSSGCPSASRNGGQGLFSPTIARWPNAPRAGARPRRVLRVHHRKKGHAPEMPNPVRPPAARGMAFNRADAALTSEIHIFRAVGLRLGAAVCRRALAGRAVGLALTAGQPLDGALANLMAARSPARRAHGAPTPWICEPRERPSLQRDRARPVSRRRAATSNIAPAGFQSSHNRLVSTERLSLTPSRPFAGPCLGQFLSRAGAGPPQLGPRCHARGSRRT